MGLTFNLGRVSPSVFTDSSLNVGIGAAPSGSYKLEVTGTAKVSGALTGAGATFSGIVNVGVAGNGFARIQPGSSTQAGYFEIFKGDGSTRLGYMGFSNTNFAFNAENSALFTFTGGAATFSSSVQADGSGNGFLINQNGGAAGLATYSSNTDRAQIAFKFAQNFPGSNSYTRVLDIVSTGDATGGGAIRFLTSAANAAPSEKMFISSGGNVGIGTTSPNQKLSIANSACIVDITSTTSTQFNALELKNGGGSFYLGQDNSTGGFYGSGSAYAASLYVSGAYPMAFFTNAAERMRITSAGNVGIGNTNPQLKLDIRTGSLGIYHNTSGSNGAQIYLGDSNFQGGTYSTSAPGIGAVFNSGSGVASDLGFYVYTGSEASRTERMRIISGGNVLIGTTSDDASIWRLQVATNADVGLRLKSSAAGYTSRFELAAAGGGASVINAQGGANTLYVSANNTNGVYITSGATSWTGNSDERLKDITGNIENAIDSLMALRTVKHTWKSDESKKEHLALIAQDVEKVFPQVIDKNKLPSKADDENPDETEYLGVRYTELVPVLVKAIQELNERLNKAGL